MTSVRQRRKEIGKFKQEAADLISTPYGSLIKTYQILNNIDMNDAAFVKLMKKDGYPFLDDDKFIQKTLANVGYDVKNLLYKPVAVCSNERNTLFCPFIYGEGEVVLLPLFKDRRMLYSQELAMANDSYQIVDWRNYEEETNNRAEEIIENEQ